MHSMCGFPREAESRNGYSAGLHFPGSPEFSPTAPNSPTCSPRDVRKVLLGLFFPYRLALEIGGSRDIIFAPKLSHIPSQVTPGLAKSSWATRSQTKAPLFYLYRL